MSAREFEQLLVTETRTAEPVVSLPALTDGVRVGVLVGFKDGCPLVTFSGQSGTAAIVARTIPDVRGEHIGKDVVLQFENGDLLLPIIMGVLRDDSAWPLNESPSQVEVAADGERLIVTAKEEIVFRCGKSSITLTKAGKVLLQGTYLLSRSSGVNRVKGGSVQIN